MRKREVRTNKEGMNRVSDNFLVMIPRKERIYGKKPFKHIGHPSSST